MAVAARRPSRGRPSRAAVEPLEDRRLLSGTTYYVSTSGSDSNPGTSSALPWATVAKVNATTFSPGDTILFERGDVWREALAASTDGTAASPITYAAYGDASAAVPLFSGGDVVDTSAATVVTGTTYEIPRTAAVNWAYVDAAFLHEALDALTQAGNATPSDPATDLNYVEATTGSFTFDPTAGELYVNTGGPLTGHLLEASTRVAEVDNNAHSYLTFDDLATTETAQDSGGYGFRDQGGSDVTIENCDSTLAGKHNFSVIDTTGFVGSGLTASQDAPDAGFGGASALVYFVDQATSGVSAGTASFTDCTFTNPDGAYPIFISHGNGTDPIGSLTLTGLRSTAVDAGIDVQATNGAEAVTISGGDLVNSGISVGTDGAVIDGVTLSGTYASVQLSGTGDVVQNCLFTDVDPNYEVGYPSAIIDGGTDSVIRLNTFAWAGNMGSAVQETSDTSGSLIEGNIFACPVGIDLNFDTGLGQVESGYNLFDADTQFLIGTARTSYTLAQWQSYGLDALSEAGDPSFTDAAAGDYTLQPNSQAIDLVGQAPSQSPVAVTTDLAGNPRPYPGTLYDAGAYEYQGVKPTVYGTYTVAAGAVPAAVAGTATSATFTVTLSAAAPVAETVQYATADGTGVAGVDYTATTGTLAFPAGVTTRDVSVPVTATGTETTFVLGLSGPSVGTLIANGSAIALTPVAPTAVTEAVGRVVATYTDADARKVQVRLAGKGAAVVYRDAPGARRPDRRQRDDRRVPAHHHPRRRRPDDRRVDLRRRAAGVDRGDRRRPDGRPDRDRHPGPGGDRGRDRAVHRRARQRQGPAVAVVRGRDRPVGHVGRPAGDGLGHQLGGGRLRHRHGPVGRHPPGARRVRGRPGPDQCQE